MDIPVRGTLISTVGSKASSERGTIVKSQGLIKPDSGLEMRHPATVIHMTRFRVSPWTFARVSRLPLTPNCKQLWTQVNLLVFRHADASPIAKASTHLQPQRWCVCPPGYFEGDKSHTPVPHTDTLHRPQLTNSVIFAT